MTDSPHPTADRIRRWSEEVARDPSSAAFLPLARAYFEQGRSDAAQRLCIRGLERHPEHVDAHVLLGQVYRAAGMVEKAFDEWDIALRLDPEHLDALRDIAHLCVEGENWAGARKHLERALAIAPDDPGVRNLVDELESRFGTASGGEPDMRGDGPEPREPRPAEGAGPEARVEEERAPDAADRAPGDRPGPESFGKGGGDGMLGAILFDAQGFVIAGTFRGDEALSDEVAAALAGASDDVERAVRHLGLGAWESVMLETSSSIVHLSPVEDALLAVAGTGDVPIGWVMRTSSRLRGDAGALLGVREDGGDG